MIEFKTTWSFRNHPAATWYQRLTQTEIVANIVSEDEKEKIIIWLHDNINTFSLTFQVFDLNDEQIFWIVIYLTKRDAMAFKLRWL